MSTIIKNKDIWGSIHKSAEKQKSLEKSRLFVAISFL
jgi:hypothetical protein